MLETPEALPIHTLSKLHYLIHERYLTNHLSFLERLNCGTHCHPLLSLNPTICHLLNLTSTNLISSPFLLKLPLIFSVFPFSGLCYRPYGFSPTVLTKKARIRFYYIYPYFLSHFLAIPHGYNTLETTLAGIIRRQFIIFFKQGQKNVKTSSGYFFTYNLPHCRA